MYLCTKLQVSSMILTNLRQDSFIILFPPSPFSLQKEPLKSPSRVGLKNLPFHQIPEKKLNTLEINAEHDCKVEFLTFGMAILEIHFQRAKY